MSEDNNDTHLHAVPDDTEQNEPILDESSDGSGSKPKFGFVVLAHEEGVVVRPLGEEEGVAQPPTVQDLFNACNAVCRNVQTQEIAQAIQQGMLEVAMVAKGQTKSGLHVPGGPKQ